MRSIILKILGCGLLALSLATQAQVGLPSGGPTMPDPTELGKLDPKNAISSTDVQRLRDLYAFEKQLKSDNPKEKERRQQEAVAVVTQEISGLKIDCEVSGADLMGVTSGKKAADVRTLYEAHCKNGMGYLLVTQPKTTSIAISCFAADAAKSADQASGKESLLYCQLPENSDAKSVSKKLLSDVKIDCDPNQVRWFGQSTARNLEYTEISCSDKTGYLLMTGLASNPVKPSAISCVEAAKQGLVCSLVKTGLVTLEDLAAGLAKNGLQCDPAKIHVFGREKVKQRHVVEALCSGKAESLVAFVPLTPQSAAFESMSCADAAKAGIKCTMINP